MDYSQAPQLLSGERGQHQRGTTAGKSPSQPGDGPKSASNPPPRVRRRNRMIQSCLECRRRKLKCNKAHPCVNCVKFNRDCVFLAPALDQASQVKLNDIKDKVGSLERQLERDVARLSGISEGKGLPDDDYDPAADGLAPQEDEKDLEPSPMASSDVTYGDEAEDDELLDLGIAIGKMRISGRIGGLFRPKISLEVERTITTSDSIKSDHRSSLTAMEPLPPAAEWLKPGPTFISPSSSFFFGQSEQSTSCVDYLPSRPAADRLIKQYFSACHPIAHTVHRPTFERQYDNFWGEIALGVEPLGSIQAIVFAAMFSGVVSMDESATVLEFGVSKVGLVDNFRLGTEAALARAKFLCTTKIETLQAFVLYLIPLCRGEISRTHSILLRMAVGIAEFMGLHRDGETYGMNALETQVRRLIWNQLCFLDIRICEAQGPRPIIRRDEFDTNFPLNIDDIDIIATAVSPQPVDRWTDSTFSLIRFEVNEMMRVLWIDRPRIEQRGISLTAVLTKIENFRKNMSKKYDHLLDDRVPIQRCAKIVKALLLSRLYIMVLHPYHLSAVLPMPDRLRNIMTSAGTTTLETAIILETSTELRPWAWYSGVFQQYHIAFLLLTEIFVNPNQGIADRIWACLDYVFECDKSEPRDTKARKVLSELQRKAEIYQGMRGMRAPVTMEKHIKERSLRDLNPGHQFTSVLSNPEPFYQEVTTPSIGKAPVQDVVYAGVANGETLWAAPPTQNSDTSSDWNSLEGTKSLPGDHGMAEIDWDQLDVLFPPEQEVMQPYFRYPDIPTKYGL